MLKVIFKNVEFGKCLLKAVLEIEIRLQLTFNVESGRVLQIRKLLPDGAWSRQKGGNGAPAFNSQQQMLEKGGRWRSEE